MVFQALRIVFAAMLGLALCGAPASADPIEPAAGGLTIRVVGDDWGAVDRQDIEAALYSVAAALTPAGELQPPRTIVVTHSDRMPIVLYRHGAAGEYLVHLHASDANWNLYVYEFAHEFCHILSNYDDQAGAGARRNQWFEESLCETASLYALKTLAERWSVAPPTAALAPGSKELAWFFDLLMAEKHRQPPDEGFAAWLRGAEGGLRQDPYQRRADERVAVRLLPLFLRDGRNWSAVRYLNLDPGDATCELDAYLEHWYRRSPVGAHGFVAAIRASLRDADRAPSMVAVAQ